MKLSKKDLQTLRTQAEEWDHLTQVEKDKIKCGGLHFQAVSNEIKFDWVNSYKDFKRKFIDASPGNATTLIPE